MDEEVELEVRVAFYLLFFVEELIGHIHQVRMHSVLCVQKERFEPVFLILACYLQSLEQRICELLASFSQVLEFVGKLRSKLFLVTDQHYLLRAYDRNEDLWFQGLGRFIYYHTKVNFFPFFPNFIGSQKIIGNQFMTIYASGANDMEPLDNIRIGFLNERLKIFLHLYEI